MLNLDLSKSRYAYKDHSFNKTICYGFFDILINRENASKNHYLSKQSV